MRTTAIFVLLSILEVSSAAVRSQEPGGGVALRNLRVIDGTGSAPTVNQTIVIDGARIATVGDNSRVRIPPGARELDLSGHTALPGLVMLHEHLIYVVNDQFSHALPFSAPRLYLAFGVTTMRTPGTDHPYVEINLKRAIERGEVPGPEISPHQSVLQRPGQRLSQRDHGHRS